MSETYCGMLNVLVLAVLAGANGVALQYLRRIDARNAERRRSDDHEDQ